jgi:hypothetical protein
LAVLSPSSFHHTKGRLAPYSCHSKDTKFNDINSGNRPIAALGVFPNIAKPRPFSYACFQ